MHAPAKARLLATAMLTFGCAEPLFVQVEPGVRSVVILGLAGAAPIGVLTYGEETVPDKPVPLTIPEEIVSGRIYVLQYTQTLEELHLNVGVQAPSASQGHDAQDLPLSFIHGTRVSVDGSELESNPIANSAAAPDELKTTRLSSASPCVLFEASRLNLDLELEGSRVIALSSEGLSVVAALHKPDNSVDFLRFSAEGEILERTRLRGFNVSAMLPDGAGGSFFAVNSTITGSAIWSWGPNGEPSPLALLPWRDKVASLSMARSDGSLYLMAATGTVARYDLSTQTFSVEPKSTELAPLRAPLIWAPPGDLFALIQDNVRFNTHQVWHLDPEQAKLEAVGLNHLTRLLEQPELEGVLAGNSKGRLFFRTQGSWQDAGNPPTGLAGDIYSIGPRPFGFMAGDRTGGVSQWYLDFGYCEFYNSLLGNVEYLAEAGGNVIASVLDIDSLTNTMWILRPPG